MLRHIPLEPLTAETFAPFGAVIEADHARSHLINAGRCRRYHALATVDAGTAGQAILSLLRATAWPQPIRIAMLERHPHGSQAFIPMERHPWLAVVAERPEPTACRAFLVRGDQGLQLARGIWHHPLLALAPLARLPRRRPRRPRRQSRGAPLSRRHRDRHRPRLSRDFFTQWFAPARDSGHTAASTHSASRREKPPWQRPTIF